MTDPTPTAAQGLATQPSTADFATLAMPHAEALKQLALRLSRDPHAADDLVQDTFARAISRWHQFDRGTNCRAWLKRILTTTFINGWRRRAKERTIVDAERADALGDRFYSRETVRRWSEPERAFLDRHLSPTVTRALAELRPEQRDVVRLSDLEELPYRDVAEALDIPIGTVMSRLFRARQALRQKLEAHARDYGILERPRAA